MSKTQPSSSPTYSNSTLYSANAFPVESVSKTANSCLPPFSKLGVAAGRVACGARDQPAANRCRAVGAAERLRASADQAPPLLSSQPARLEPDETGPIPGSNRCARRRPAPSPSCHTSRTCSLRLWASSTGRVAYLVSLTSTVGGPVTTWCGHYHPQSA